MKIYKYTILLSLCFEILSSDNLFAQNNFGIAYNNPSWNHDAHLSPRKSGIGYLPIQDSESDSVARLLPPPVNCCGDKIISNYKAILNSIYGSPYTFILTEYKDEPGATISKTHPQRNLAEPDTYQEFSNRGNLGSDYQFQNISYNVDELLKETIIDEAGNVTESYKDKFGQLVAIRTPIGPSYTFDSNGNIIWNTGSQPDFASTYFFYDLAGHLIKTIDPENKSTEYFYNSAGQLFKEKSPDKGILEYRYDQFGRMRFVKDNKDADLIQQGLCADLFTFNKYDKWGRLIATGKLRVENGSPTEFNDLALINNQDYPSVNANGIGYLKLMTYDNSKTDNSINRLYKETVYLTNSFYAPGIFQPSDDVEFDECTYTYTNNGQLKSKLFQFAGLNSQHQLSYTYNKAGLPTSSGYKNLSNTAYDFIETMSYDDFGRVKETKSGKTLASLFTDAAYKYDAMGNLFVKSICNNTGNISDPFRDYISFNYNIRGQQTLQISKKFRYKLSYDIRNNIISQMWSNNQFDNTSSPSICRQSQYEYYYDAMNRLIGANYTEVGSSNNPYVSFPSSILQPQSDFSIFTGALHLQATALYPLDAPITGITYPTRGRVYDNECYYSKAGNFTQLNRYDNSALQTKQDYTYANPNNQLTNVQFTTPSGTSQSPYNYDKNGNLTNDGFFQITSIAYNPYNMAEQIYKANGDITNYRYNAYNQRTVKKINTLLQEYYIGQVIVDENGRPKQYGTSAGYIELDNINNSLKRKYTIEDWLGNVRMVIDETGAIVNSRDHYPYGKLMPGRVFESNVEGKRFQFTGQEHDPETGYDYFGARYYNRELGRFVGADLLSSATPNWTNYRYGYCNPIRYNDPSGNNEDDILLNKKGEELARNKKDGPDYYYMATNRGDYKWTQKNIKTGMILFETRAIRVNSVESVTGDPRENERAIRDGGKAGFNGTLNEKFTYPVQQGMINAIGINNISGYLDIAYESDHRHLDYYKRFTRGELINLNGIYYNNHEALNYMWAASMSEINKQGKVFMGPSIMDIMTGAGLYNIYDFVTGDTKSILNQSIHNQVIVRGYIYNYTHK